MIRASFIVGFLSALATVLPGCGAEADPKTDENAPAPKLVVGDEQADFGRTIVGRKVSHRFSVKNTGEEAITLGEPEMMPASLKYDFDCRFSAKRIDPGQAVTIDLTVHPRSTARSTYVGVIIKGSNGDQFRIGGRITVEDLLILEPDDPDFQFWRMKTGSDGEPMEFKGMLHSAEVVELTAKSSNPDIAVELKPFSNDKLKSMNARTGADVHVRAKKPTTVGAFATELTFQTVKPPVVRKSVRVVGVRTGPLLKLSTSDATWEPRQLSINFGRFDAARGKTIRAVLLLAVPKDFSGFQWKGVETSDPLVSAKLRPMKRSTATRKWAELTLNVAGGRKPATRNQSNPVQITISTTHPGANEIRFRALLDSHP